MLPASLDVLDKKFEIVEKPLAAPSFDFMWSGVAEDGREKQLEQQAFILGGNELPAANEYPSEDIFVADAALKVCAHHASLLISLITCMLDDSRHAERGLRR